jgi:hypothetical protein
MRLGWSRYLEKPDGPEGAAKVVTGKHTHEYHALTVRTLTLD